MVNESLLARLQRVDRGVGYRKSAPVLILPHTVVRPCTLKLYAIRFSDGRKDHIFSAENDRQALDFTRDILSIHGKINQDKFEKKGAEALLCVDRQVFPPIGKTKKKK